MSKKKRIPEKYQICIDVRQVKGTVLFIFLRQLNRTVPFILNIFSLIFPQITPSRPTSLQITLIFMLLPHFSKCSTIKVFLCLKGAIFVPLSHKRSSQRILYAIRLISELIIHRGQSISALLIYGCNIHHFQKLGK